MNQIFSQSIISSVRFNKSSFRTLAGSVIQDALRKCEYSSPIKLKSNHTRPAGDQNTNMYIYDFVEVYESKEESSRFLATHNTVQYGSLHVLLHTASADNLSPVAPMKQDL